MLSCVQLFVTPGTIAYHASLLMGFSRQKYWSGLSFPSPRDLPDRGTESTSVESPALTGRFFPWDLWEVPYYCVCVSLCVCLCVCVFSCSVMSDSFPPHELWPARLLCPWDFPGKNAGVGCHSILWGIFLAQGLNLGLLHCRQILYWLSHQWSPLAHIVFFKDLVSLCLSSLLCLSW